MQRSPTDLFSLAGKVAIVAGASSGLGAEFVEALESAGARVVAAARRTDRLEALAARLPGVLPVTCDLSHDEDRVALVDQAHAEFGPVDTLVNTAAIIGGRVTAEELTPELFHEVLEINLVSPLRLGALVIPDMRTKGNGAIVNVASISGLVGMGVIPQAAYAASKSGLIGMTRELALQWAPDGVRVNAIAPSFFESEMTARTFATPHLTEWVESNTPLHHRGKPNDFVGALLLLASDAGRFITGQTIVVDGGWTAR